MKHFSMLCMLAFLLLIQPCYAETVRLTSLDWPPYTGKDLKQSGASVAVAKAAFKSVGYDLTVEFFPWKRAVAYGKENPDYDGYFPEYYAEYLKNDFVLSVPMGNGPLGFAERTDKPITWNTLNDLKQYKIGVVSGYVNTAAFDEMVSNGGLKVSAAGSDLKNLQKLLSGRIDAAVIDTNVMNHLLTTSDKLKEKASQIHFNIKPLENKALYICFRKNERGMKLSSVFNQGLKLIDVDQIMSEYCRQ